MCDAEVLPRELQNHLLHGMHCGNDQTHLDSFSGCTDLRDRLRIVNAAIADTGIISIIFEYPKPCRAESHPPAGMFRSISCRFSLHPLQRLLKILILFNSQGLAIELGRVSIQS